MSAAAELVRVYARDILVHAVIGVNPGERDILQPLFLDIEVEIAMPDVDAIQATIDYRDLQSAAQEEAAVGDSLLIETFARRVARRCIDRLPGPGTVSVEIRKPLAIAPAKAGVTFRMTRS